MCGKSNINLKKESTNWIRQIIKLFKWLNCSIQNIKDCLNLENTITFSYMGAMCNQIINMWLFVQLQHDMIKYKLYQTFQN